MTRPEAVIEPHSVIHGTSVYTLIAIAPSLAIAMPRHVAIITYLPIQKSSGNRKDLLQIHISIRLVGRNHTHLRRYYKCAVIQIDC